MRLRWASDAPTWPGKAEITIAHAMGFLKDSGIDQAEIRAIPGEIRLLRRYWQEKLM